MSATSSKRVMAFAYYRLSLLRSSRASPAASSAAKFTASRRHCMNVVPLCVGTFLALVLFAHSTQFLFPAVGGDDRSHHGDPSTLGLVSYAGGAYRHGTPSKPTYLDAARNLTWDEWNDRGAALGPPDARCPVNVSLPLVPYQPRSPVRWLHAPKTGTSFLTTIMRRYCDVGDDFAVGACVTASYVKPYIINFIRLHCRHSMYVPAGEMLAGSRPLEPIVDHTPLYARDVPHAYGLFRSPTARMASHYQFFVNRSDPYSPEMSLKVFPTESDFLAAPQYQGCQTKMLIGYYCGHPMVLNASHQRDAQGVIDAMRFVGISDYFDLSVELFHAIFGGKDHPAEHLNNRPGRVNHAASAALSADLPNAARKPAYEVVQWNAGRNGSYAIDDVEEQVFAFAVKRFRLDLAQYLPDRVRWVKPYTPLRSSNKSAHANQGQSL